MVESTRFQSQSAGDRRRVSRLEPRFRGGIMIRFATITLFIVSVILTSGCGGSGGNGDPLPGKGGTGGGTGGISVVVTPSGIGQVWEGTTVQFAAQVIGKTNQTVTWAVQEGSAGG